MILLKIHKHPGILKIVAHEVLGGILGLENDHPGENRQACDGNKRKDSKEQDAGSNGGQHDNSRREGTRGGYACFMTLLFRISRQILDCAFWRTSKPCSNSLSSPLS